MNRFGYVAALMLAATAALAAPAQATKPLAQTFEIVAQITGPNTIAGTWTGAGVVDDGGRYFETFRFAGGTVHVEQVLTGSKGTIVLRSQTPIAWIDDCTATFQAGSWQIVGGTGAYARLRGGGTPAVEPSGFGDICTGEVRATKVGQVHDD